MDFIPSKTYSGLLNQAIALYKLINSMENELKFYRSQPLVKDDEKYKSLQRQIDSEREMNQILTNELDKLK